MNNKQSNFTDKEMEDLKNIVTDTLASVCVMADKHSIDRDSMLKYFADMLTALAEFASIQNYETNYTCSCQHNSNPRDSEPCCRCDSRQTNADRIRNMSDEELAELLFNKSRCDNCFANCNDKDNCPSLGSCYSRHLEWLQS